jgi:hypothetical protein
MQRFESSRADKAVGAAAADCGLAREARAWAVRPSAFAENNINFAILPDLTDQDLKEIGVASLGHRRQLLRAITELVARQHVQAATEFVAPLTPSGAPSAAKTMAAIPSSN